MVVAKAFKYNWYDCPNFNYFFVPPESAGLFVRPERGLDIEGQLQTDGRASHVRGILLYTRCYLYYCHMVHIMRAVLAID